MDANVQEWSLVRLSAIGPCPSFVRIVSAHRDDHMAKIWSHDSLISVMTEDSFGVKHISRLRFILHARYLQARTLNSIT
jgi:hypothetical protein